MHDGRGERESNQQEEEAEETERDAETDAQTSVVWLLCVKAAKMINNRENNNKESYSSINVVHL